MPIPSAIAELLPNLITALPGPRAQAIMARDHQVLSPSYTRGYPLVMKRGEGAVVEDVDGNRFLDFAAGIAVVATGLIIRFKVRILSQPFAAVNVSIYVPVVVCPS